MRAVSKRSENPVGPSETGGRENSGKKKKKMKKTGKNAVYVYEYVAK